MAIYRTSGENYVTYREVLKGDRKTPLPYLRYKHTYNDTFRSPTGQSWFSPKALVQGKELALLARAETFVPLTQRITNSNDRAHIHNRALSKLDEKFNTATSLFEAWYERREVVNMATAAAKQILRFVRNWRKPSYWKSLGTASKQPKSLPEAWLAYNFGLKPLIGTIDHLFNTLGEEFPVYQASVTSNGMIGNKIIVDETTIWCDVDYTVKMGGRAKSYNPNTSIIGVTGLNQPLTSFMSVVPWGWAVDYFVNASSMCQNIDAKHPGVTIDRQWTTVITRGTYHGVKDLKRTYYYSTHKRDSYPINGELLRITRSLGNQTYKLEFSLPLLGSGQFANLMSALALSMKGKK